MRIYIDRILFGRPVYVCHPRGFPPCPAESWERCSQEQIDKLLPFSDKTGREIRYFDMDFNPTEKPILLK